MVFNTMLPLYQRAILGFQLSYETGLSIRPHIIQYDYCIRWQLERCTFDKDKSRSVPELNDSDFKTNLEIFSLTTNNKRNSYCCKSKFLQVNNAKND